MSEDFDYPGFASTDELTLNEGAIVVDGAIVLADLATTFDARQAFRTVPATFDEDWEMTFRIRVGPETSDYLREDDTPYQADGWAIVWATTPFFIGGTGEDVGYFGGAGVENTRGLAFRLWEYLDLIWSDGGAFTDQRLGKDWRGDNYYWLEYDSVAEELRVFFSTDPYRPTDPTETFTGVSFGDGEWYLGVTSATGAATMNATLKAWAFEPQAGTGWGLLL